MRTSLDWRGHPDRRNICIDWALVPGTGKSGRRELASFHALPVVARVRILLSFLIECVRFYLSYLSRCILTETPLWHVILPG